MKNAVYQIQNIRTGTIYIGSSVNYLSRKRNHLCDLRKNRHHSTYMQRAYNKYGVEIFVFSILEYDLDDAQLRIREQHYIDTLNPKYNMSKTANGTSRPVSEATKKKISKSLKGRKIHDEVSKAAIGRATKGNTYGVGLTNKRKVTKEIYFKILTLREQGLGCRKIATIVKLDKTTILNVFNKKYDYGYDK